MNPRPTAHVVCSSAPGLRRALIALVLSALPAAALCQPASVSLVDAAYLSAANSGQVNPQQFTVEAKFRADGPGYGQTSDPVGATIVAKPSQNTSGGWIAAWSLSWSPTTNHVAFFVSHVFDAVGTVVYSNAVIQQGSAAHVAASFDGFFLRLYINGELDASVAAAQPGVYVRTADQIVIGAGNYSQTFSRRWQGSIDDVRVWDYARSTQDIRDGAWCQLSQGPRPGLLANWVFDSQSSVDVSGNAHDASFIPPEAASFAGPLSQTPPTFASPSDSTICPEGTAIFALSVVGSAPLSYQWQVNIGTPQAPQWCDLSDLEPGGGCMGNSGGGPSHASFNGSWSPTLSISALLPADARQYRCTVTNSCGSITSQPAALILCAADFDCDGTIDFFDYDAFVTCFEGVFCPPGKSADFDGDGAADFFDYDAFVVAFETGC
ncbi:MAG: LamG-like jellyroll fold domain-containing protein [Planctomycetota bacterium]